MLRRQLLSGLLMTVVLIVLLGLVYPVAVWAVGQVVWKDRANGSIIERNGKAVGSKLIGQSFADKDGNPLPQYFQPRPSKAGDGYDGLSSGGSNYGPSNPLLIGNVPGVADGLTTSKTNPYATPADPYCVPVQATDKAGNDVVDAQGNPVYEKSSDGTYVCNPGTVPERAIAYRVFNGLAANASVPVDAVTASGSGLDPHISTANARLQAARVAKARNLPLATVMKAIDDHTDSASFGFLGVDGVNVLELNLALDSMHP
jgi:K+-transporting ATPase ATPase C chain